MLKDQQSQLDEQKRHLDEQTQLITSMQTQIDQINQRSSSKMSEEDVALRSRLETLESSIQASPDSANTTFDEDSFSNSMMIPGTNAAFKMGGFVKVNIVETFDPLGTLDRFIAGTIPVPQQSSTLNLSWVDVDNLSFEDDTAYDTTFRGSLNYIWSPTPRIDLGVEVIYGKRRNKNGEEETAAQFQISSKYRF